jgi:hypothetical protein
MGGNDQGVADKKTVRKYYNRVASEAGLEGMAMLIDEIEGPTISFKQFTGLFTAWGLPDEQMEDLLAKVKVESAKASK